MRKSGYSPLAVGGGFRVRGANRTGMKPDNTSPRTYGELGQFLTINHGRDTCSGVGYGSNESPHLRWSGKQRWKGPQAFKVGLLDYGVVE